MEIQDFFIPESITLCYCLGLEKHKYMKNNLDDHGPRFRVGHKWKGFEVLNMKSLFFSDL